MVSWGAMLPSTSGRIAVALCALGALARPAFSDEKPARAAAGAQTLRLGAGAQAVDLPFLPAVTLSVHARPEQPAREVTLAPVWVAEPGASDGARRLRADLADEESGARITLRLSAGADGAPAELTAEIRYERRAWLSLAALDFTLPGRAQVLDRDLAPRPAGSVAFLDRFGPKTIRAGSSAAPLTAFIDDGIDGVVVRRAPPEERAGERAAERTGVRVELFSSEARPFLYDARCREEWWKENPRIPHAARLREPGDRDLARVELRAGDAPVVSKVRWPEGRGAALVITDHADQSGPDSFTALARGRSDADRPVGGLLGHHLVITKSLFMRGGVHEDFRPQLEDPRVATIADELARAGSEIIPHSATPNPDDRDTTAAGLAAFARFHGATWIDHQPETNCEAFTNQGWRGGGDPLAGKWRIADLLAKGGYHYFWSAIDQDEWDLLWTGRLDKRALTVWPLGRLAPGDPDDRWLFKTVWGLVDQETFFRELGPERLDRLEQVHGVLLMHTYLESLHTAESSPRFAGRNVLRRGPAGLIETGPRLEKVFEDLERRIAAGTLWMPTMKGLGDWLSRLDRVSVRPDGDGGARVLSPVDLAGVTLSAPGEVDVLIDGAPPRGRRTGGGATVFWFDLKANRPVRVELRARRVLEASGGSLPGPAVKSMAAARAE